MKDEVRPWTNRAWLAATVELPINPVLKCQLLKELYEFRYEPFHEPGAKVYVNDVADISWPEETVVSHIAIKEPVGKFK